jgi:S-DNA-T family DNA segregation ATPase FtsK/SpoIIIE
MGIFDFFKKKITSEIDSVSLEENDFTEEIKESSIIEEEFIPVVPCVEKENIIIEEAFDALEELGVYDPKLDLSWYKFPTFSLLEKTETDVSTEQTIEPFRLVKILESFRVRIKSITKNAGAIITVFEIVPEPGVKISTLRRLEEDIAVALSTRGVSIIPIPERGTIGIVVPNKHPRILPLELILNTDSFQSQNELPIAIGKTMTNDIFTFDLCQMPHLLVAGATGQGKSVSLNVMIASLLYKKHPAELKLVLIDPRVVEFNTYLPIQNHFLAKRIDSKKAIISEISDAINTLDSLVKEMSERYNLLAKSNAHDIKEYNDKFIHRELNPSKGHKYMPHIVVVIDEFADFVIFDNNRLSVLLNQLASKAHTIGIHLIISTQCPSSKIITRSIKANFPARLAFKVASSTVSRIILDESGAEQLTGRGDALFSYGGKTIRIQIAYAGTRDIEKIALFIGQQQSYSSAYCLPEYVETYNYDSLSSVDLSDKDPLFNEAAHLIVIHQQGSTSLIQRKFSIGYNRAGRLMNQLEAAGIVGSTQGSSAREVYIQDEYHLERILNSLR